MKCGFQYRVPAAAVLGLLAALAGCDQINPTVSFSSMAIQRLGLDATEYMATCDVTNPNGFVMQVEEVRWTLAGRPGELVSGELHNRIELPANKSVPVHIHLQVPHALLDRAGLDQQNQFNYDFGGQFRISGPLGLAEVPFSNTGRMPIIREMKIAWSGMEYIGTTESQVGLALLARVTNTNDLMLTPTQLAGQLMIDERPLVQIDTELKAMPPIPPRQETELRIPIWVNSPEVGVRSLSKMVTAPGARFRLVGAMEFRMPGTGDINDLLTSQPAMAGDMHGQPTTEPDAPPH